MTLGESKVSRAGNSQLRAIPGDDNVVGSKGSSLSSDLDSVVEVFLEESNIENLIVDGLRAVDDELDDILLSLDLL